MDDTHWEILSQKPSWHAWSGYAFEAVCFKHIKQIKQALKIPDGSDVFSWRHAGTIRSGDGAQIDLVFDRPDGIVNLCEIKYSKKPFSLDKAYAEHLMKRAEIYNTITKNKKQVFHTLIVPHGLKKTMYSEALISAVVTLKHFFI